MADRTPDSYLTVIGVIAELVRQIEIDADRADQPVVFAVTGKAGRHPAVTAVSVGNGRDEKVLVLCGRNR